jgi:hypothetical protein
MTNVSMSMPTRRVEMWYSGTAPQRRVTVVFRIILAIPQFIVLFFLGIAGFVVAVIGWFAALFTGRLPDFAHTFLSGLIRWEIRVNAYLFLLTDHYPPFSLEDEEYPVRPILPGPGSLNRLSVFFRIILAVPAAVFAQIVAYGLGAPLLIAMWIVVIVTGRMPPTLYTTYAALLRYQTRLHSWFVMVTSEYAWGMFGDFVPPPPPTSPPPLGAVSGGEVAAVPLPPPAAPPAPAAPLDDSGARRGPASGAAVLVPVDRRAGGLTARLSGRRPGFTRTPAAHAAANVVGAHVDRAVGGAAPTLGDSHPAGRSERLDDLRHRLGLHRLHRGELIAGPRPSPQDH